MHAPRITQFQPHYPATAAPANDIHGPRELPLADAVIRGLLQPHYASIIAAGCSDGDLNAALRARGDRFLGLTMPGAPRLARVGRSRDIALREVDFPRRWPRRKADLIVLSAGLWPLEGDGLSLLARHVDGSLMPGGEVAVIAGPGASGAASARAFCRALRQLRPCSATLCHPAEGHQHRTLRCRRNGPGLA